MIELRSGIFYFSPSSGSGPRADQQFFNFSAPVGSAVAGLSGFDFGFASPNDHELGEVVVRLDTEIDDDTVTVRATFGVRDWSGIWDDDYEGTIQYDLLAELLSFDSPTALSITGVEFSQATQYFRSEAGALARPDNSIALVGGKNTTVRVYSNTSNTSSTPTVLWVGGVLDVRNPDTGAWEPMGTLNGPIAAIADDSINRQHADHTLNFVIPGAICHGTIEYRVRIFDHDHSGQQGFSSGRLQGSRSFLNVGPLRLHAIAVNHVGDNPHPAVDISDVSSMLRFAAQIFPFARVEIASFETIDFDGDLGQSSAGYNSGWYELVEYLQDLKGDDPDIYLGVISFGPPGGLANGRVCASSPDPYVVAHELGHTLERLHAPCGNPDNTDPDFPYDTAKIGEVGVNDFGDVYGTSFYDIMSYCDDRWISPYTYQGILDLAQTLAVSLYCTDAPSDQSVLFMRVRVYGNGLTLFRHSFHYPARRTSNPGIASPYVLLLEDDQARVFASERMRITDPCKTLDSAWIDFFVPIEYHESTSRVVVARSTDGRYEEVGSLGVAADRPIVRILPFGNDVASGSLVVRWESVGDTGDLRYQLRYSNDGRLWRGVSGSMSEQEYVVDLRRLPGGDDCRFQVLATSGIRTGSDISPSIAIERRPRELSIRQRNPIDADQSEALLVAECYSADFGTPDQAEMEWAVDDRSTVDVGKTFDLRRLDPGVHTVSVSAPDGLGGVGSATFEVRVASDGNATAVGSNGEVDRTQA